METGEIVAIVVVVVVLLLGSVFLCFRCWRAVAEVVEDDQKPKRQTLASSVRDGLRRSFRASMRRMSGIRNSFRRSGGRGSRGGAGKMSVTDAADARRRKAPTVATIQGLQRETSELHPAYLKQTIRLEEASSVPRGSAGGRAGPVPSDPTAGLGGTLKPNPGEPTQEGQYPNPLYSPESGGKHGAKVSGISKVRSHLSGYKRMEEESSPTHQPYNTAMEHHTRSTRYNEDSHHHQGGTQVGGYSNAVYEGSPTKSPPTAHHQQRYDLPFEDGPPQGQSQGHREQVVCDLHRETVAFPGSEERNTGAESTYI